MLTDRPYATRVIGPGIYNYSISGKLSVTLSKGIKFMELAPRVNRTDLGDRNFTM